MSILVILNHNNFRVLFDNIAAAYFIWKIYLNFRIGIASPENEHCANCIGTLSFPMGAEGAVQSINQFIYRDNASHDIIATG